MSDIKDKINFYLLSGGYGGSAVVCDLLEKSRKRIINLEVDLRDETARAEAAEAKMAWQLIETAPKDRMLLLGYRNSHGNWRTLRGRWVTQNEIDEDWYDIDGYEMNHCYEGWYEESVEAEDDPNMWTTTPTHWMPSPEPPEVTE
jgi:hypothetical protein